MDFTLLEEHRMLQLFPESLEFRQLLERKMLYRY